MYLSGDAMCGDKFVKGGKANIVVGGQNVFRKFICGARLCYRRIIFSRCYWSYLIFLCNFVDDYKT